MENHPKTQLVVNWHILEDCNFGCDYCYAHWPDMKRPEAWHSSSTVSKILDELSHMPSVVEGEWEDCLRLNLAGGEPMLLWKNGQGPLSVVMDEAERCGFAVSIITNGYLMTDTDLQVLAPRLQILGVSMDSANPDTNQKIGRCGKGKKSQQISYKRVAEIFDLARKINPKIECKLNTVVCAENWQEDFHAVIQEIAPDRWKVFQMLPIADSLKIKDKQQPLVVTTEQFKFFISKHDDLDIMRPENNDEMTESYVMVDPFGRFYQNESAEIGYRHIVSDPIHEIGAKDAWQKTRFDSGKFNHRYIPMQPV